jgi:hypothetical protein
VYYETFAIVVTENKSIDIIPFDWFNKTGGDYGYMWPATAQVNIQNRELESKGMRMADFKV